MTSPSPATPNSHWVGSYFADIGEEIGRRFCETGQGHAAFADVAAVVLHERAPVQPIDATAMAEWIVTTRDLPRQVNFHASFGEPPLVVYEQPSFYLEVLFWFPSRTGIHGHGFSGAFRVLAGCSIQVTYSFTEAEILDDGLRLGALIPRQLELLEPGAICRIDADEAFVHAVAHLGNPSLTLVARTVQATATRQSSYHRSGIAHATYLRRNEIVRRVEVLAALARAAPERARLLGEEMLVAQDVFGRFTTLLHLAAKRTLPPIAAILEVARSRWPRVAALADEVCQHEDRTKRIYDHLGLLPDSHAQLLAVLGEFFGSKDGLLRQLATSYPGSAPEATLARWAALVPHLPKALP